jgi:DNA polymerase III epsilon subunit-like protein
MDKLILFLDTETNGLPKRWDLSPYAYPDNWPRLAELGWVAIPSNQLVGGADYDVDSYLIKPDGWRMPAAVGAVNGISQQLLDSQGLPVRDVLQMLKQDFDDADFVVAHNVDFDRSVLGAELTRVFGHKIAEERLRAVPWLCTMRKTADVCRIPGARGWKWPRLEELHRFLFNEDSQHGQHRAEADVRTLVDCYRELRRREVV